MQPQQHLVIIGNGIAGITLAQQVRKKSYCPITLISSESEAHFSRPALMYVYMGHMCHQDIIPYADWYYQEQNLTRIHDKVVSVDYTNRTLKLENNEHISYDVLVFATGSCPAFYNWPGTNSKGVQGLVTLQDLELMELQTATTKEAVVVGGGLIGIEMAEMLRSRGIVVTMLVRDKLFWGNNLPSEEATLVTNHIQQHGINVLLQEELEEIIADATAQVEAVKTKSEKLIPCQFVGIATGVKPNINFIKASEIQTDIGILVDEFFNTNIKDVYAIGDCAQFKKPAAGAPAVEQLWYTARLHGEALAFSLTNTPTSYQRGPWFNSAKFLDIEFQTYGIVPPKPDPLKFSSLYWEHTEKNKAIRIMFNRETEKLVGINLLGVRYRHDLCHHWLKEEYSIHDVIQELKAVNFDTEFFRRFEPELVKQYQLAFPDKEVAKEHSSWWKLKERFQLYHHKPKTSKKYE